MVFGSPPPARELSEREFLVPIGTPDAVLLSNLGQIDRLVTHLSRKQALLGADSDDFASWVRLRLLEDDYRILRGFRGNSKLSTYLTTVVMNLARDYRIQKWGRWRPSAAAKRLGTVGIQLDTLLHRDGYTEDIPLMPKRDLAEVLLNRFLGDEGRAKWEEGHHT